MTNIYRSSADEIMVAVEGYANASRDHSRACHAYTAHEAPYIAVTAAAEAAIEARAKVREAIRNATLSPLSK